MSSDEKKILFKMIYTHISNALVSTHKKVELSWY